ncbi:porin [Methylobacter sp.]|uniref:OprO/OprP family phosphate-selective porin n=1 Tax=Methylobacter sp. TaxID=2051955 RepID=UPI00120B65FD|nr:porin [Methylobacter sp.]TAK63204.1 MAG: porin [Methylobacter sp.]
MKISKLTLAIATVLGAGATSGAFAMELYVDTKTKQIYAEPGPHRQLLGSFEKVQDAPAKAADKADTLDKAEIKAIREDLALKQNEIKALQEHAAEASGPESVHVKLSDGIHFATKDGNFTAGINGRLQVDSQTNVNNQVANATNGNTTNALADGMSIRRARLGIEGTFFKDTDYKFEYDFTRGNGTTGAGVTDAFIRYNFSKPFSVKFGAFKEPFSLEEATSNRYITFIQRNQAVDTFVDDLNTYKMGIGANYATERWQVGTSLQTEPVGANGASNSSLNTNGNANRNNGSGDTNWEVNARVTGLPWMESKTKFLHVGTSGSYVDVNNNYLANGTFSNGSIAFAHGLNNNVDRTAILNTGTLTSGNIATGNQVNHFTRFGAESALVYGPFSAQGEYIATNISGRGYNNGETLDGYYGYMTYFLTGESRAYKAKTGAWDRLKPNRNFDMKGGWGAWEVAAGYDALNLNSGVIRGGRASTAKFGINWYPNSHVRVMANYIHALDINTQGVNNISTAGVQTANTRAQAFNNADLDVIETRVQLDW